MDRSGLTSIEDANSAGNLPVRIGTPKFESKTRCPRNSPLQDRRTVDLRGFRGGSGAPTPSRSVRDEFRPHLAICWPRSRPMLFFDPKCRCRSACPPLLVAKLDQRNPTILLCFPQRIVWHFPPCHSARSATTKKTAVSGRIAGFLKPPLLLPHHQRANGAGPLAK